MLRRQVDGGSRVQQRVPPIVREVLSSGGTPLDAGMRAFMEPRFGHDFSHVRVHTDTRATESADQVHARAYTVGSDIVCQKGECRPGSVQGRSLLAHELSHVLQQSQPGTRHPAAQAALEVAKSGDPYEQEADRIAGRVMGTAGTDIAPVGAVSAVPAGAVQRQAPAAAPAVSKVTLSFGNFPVHVPPCGPDALVAQADVGGVTWSLVPDPTPLAPGTTIAANGHITIGAGQAAGQIQARATDAAGTFAGQSFGLSSHPIGISSTSVVGPPAAPVTDYGAVFDHVFISSDGNVASLEGVPVGERFIDIPNPTAATHNVTAPPFGTFQLATAALEPDASNNWHLTAAGELGGTHDNVTIQRAPLNVGRFIHSASNPSPPSWLPATATLRQGLHWFCRQAAPASRWRMPAFVTVAHSRTLRNSGGSLEVVVTVNGVEQVDTYDGPVGVLNVNASPVSTPRSEAAPSAPRTVRVDADTLPSALPAGVALLFRFVGTAQAALGCTIASHPNDNHAAILTVGTTAGTVVAEVADPTGVNRARVQVVIT